MEQEVIDAEIVHQGEKVLLKRVYRPKGGPTGEGSSTGAKSNGGGWRPEDPKKSAEIRRMACQRAAIELLTAEVAAGRIPADAKPTDLLVPRIKWLEEDVIDAGLRAELPDGR